MNNSTWKELFIHIYKIEKNFYSEDIFLVQTILFDLNDLGKRRNIWVLKFD